MDINRLKHNVNSNPAVKLAKRVKQWLLDIKNTTKARKAFNSEMGGGTGIEVALLLLNHSLEKGMGLPSPHPGFGYKKAEHLLSLLETYHENKLDESRYAYQESIAVLNAYLQFTDNDVSELKKRFLVIACEHDISEAGFKMIPDMNSLYDKLEFESIEYFLQSRHSIRNYQKKSVSIEKIRSVIELANKAPSACNRQPVRVYVTVDQRVVSQVSVLIPGNKGFEDEIPNWAIVTADRTMFGSSESLQWYVNGGIYIAYLVEAFHAHHIGSCIFQVPNSHDNTRMLRKLVSIPDHEAIIAAVGFGYAENSAKVLTATRRPIEETLVWF